MARNYAALPHDYIEEMADLSDAEFGRLIRTLLIYSKTGREETLSGGERYLWRRVRSQEDRFQESYGSASNAKSEAGKKGAAKRWQRMAEDSTAWQGMAEDSKNGYTETETNTETKTKTYLPLASASREDSAQAREAGLLPAYCETEERFVEMIRWRLQNGIPLREEMIPFVLSHPEIDFGKQEDT